LRRPAPPLIVRNGFECCSLSHREKVSLHFSALAATASILSVGRVSPSSVQPQPDTPSPPSDGGEGRGEEAWGEEEETDDSPVLQAFLKLLRSDIGLSGAADVSGKKSSVRPESLRMRTHMSLP